jgi:hypothetical protein
MLSTVLFAAVTVLSSPGELHSAFPTAQDAVLVSVNGLKAVSTPVAAHPPKDVARQRARVAVFGGRQGVRTEDGKVVNGMGFIAWRHDHSVVVAVFVLVPGGDQPNTNVDVTAGYEQLSHRHLINYVLKDSEPVEVKEAASLGFGTTIMQLVPAKAP